MNVLVLAAHPDDELLGLGATLARHSAAGDLVTAVVVAEGVSVRYEAGTDLTECGRRSALVLGMKEIRFLGLRDQHLDAGPILDVIQPIERVVQEIRPEIVYTHHWGDLNRDHRIVSEAVMVACRPVGHDYPREVLMFETPSASEWSWPDPSMQFTPNHFVDVTETIEKKLAAMACYETEVRPPPHPRSLEALRARAQFWGQIVSATYAEAFVVARRVVR